MFVAFNLHTTYAFLPLGGSVVHGAMWFGDYRATSFSSCLFPQELHVTAVDSERSEVIRICCSLLQPALAKVVLCDCSKINLTIHL